MIRFFFFTFVVWSCFSFAGDPVGESELQTQAEALSARFVGQLKPALKQAMSEGGPAQAIEVCATRAPRIAAALSDETGWLVKRVSLNPRNASRAQPDRWETAVLQEFDQRLAAGEDKALLVKSATVQNHYRYMRVQVTEGICLTCHGTNLPEAARTTLSKYYPDDAATGYQLGEVRGAISLTRRIK